MTDVDDAIVSLSAHRSADDVGDDTLALLFSATHCGALRYVAAWGQWLRWAGAVWERDTTLAVYDMVRSLCRAQIAPGTDARTAKYLRRATTVAAVEHMARSDRRHAATADQWDADPWLLGTPGGTVDLRTGMLKPADRGDHITKLTTVAPDFDAGCPLWLAFLSRITDGNEALEDYLQRLVGYCLTGSTREQMFAFFYGTGANGKGVFLNTVSAILGAYAHVAPADTFEASRGDRHPTELAALQGARLVCSQETEEGRRWAESRIKALTGADPITARYMRQDFFTFLPTFKLLMAGNHRPGLRNIDEAMRRRLHMVPFEVSIPKSERDPHLVEKLRAEHGAILAWAIGGCLAWQTTGLQPPECVVAATAEYFSAQDSFSAWLDERTERASPHTWESSSELFASWRSWADAANEHAGDAKAFAEAMRRKGFEAKRNSQTRKTGWLGLQLVRADYTDSGRYGG